MKTSILLSIVSLMFAFSLFSFTMTDNKYPSDSTIKNMSMWERDYLKTINNTDLNAVLSYNFQSLFDEVTAVDAAYNDEMGHYFVVFGKQNQKEKVEMISVNEEEVEHEFYSTLHFANVNVSSQTSFCRSSFNGNCSRRATLVICGTWNGSECIPL